MRELLLIVFVFLTSLFSNSVFEFFIPVKNKEFERKVNFLLRNPILKISNVVLGLLCFYKLSFSLGAFVVFLFLSVFVVISFVDQKIMLIPDGLILFLCVIASVWYVIFNDLSLLERIMGLFSVSIPMFVVNYFLKDSFGVGDIKLFVICGFILGWQKIILAFIISSIACSMFSLILVLLKRKKADSRIAFAPYIFLGVAVSLFYGNEIIDFYLSRF